MHIRNRQCRLRKKKNNQVMVFAEDIHKRIKTDFAKEEVENVETKLKKTVDIGLNVGEGQFVRSVIFLANKSKEKLDEILNEFDDPRDVIFEAEEKSGRLNHWFAISFDEIERLTKVVEKQIETKISEYENLPPDLFENDLEEYNM